MILFCGLSKSSLSSFLKLPSGGVGVASCCCSLIRGSCGSGSGGGSTWQ